MSFRYRNWLDYAEHMSRRHHFESWAEDLLNDVIEDILNKPTEKINGMLSRKTKKIVNGVPTTELDKFILAVLNRNASSPLAPFRKNTLGNKILSRKNGIETRHTEELNGYECEAEDYDNTLNNKLDKMHRQNIKRLSINGFNTDAIKLYHRRFIRGQPLDEFTEAQQDAITRIQQFLIVTKKTLLDD